MEELDRRPAMGEPYRRVEPVAPVQQAVPAHAPAAPLLPMPLVRPSRGGRYRRRVILRGATTADVVETNTRAVAL